MGEILAHFLPNLPEFVSGRKDLDTQISRDFGIAFRFLIQRKPLGTPVGHLRTADGIRVSFRHHPAFDRVTAVAG
jgi:hypothetical protein